MGMYKELIFGASLKADTPVSVIETIKYMMGEDIVPSSLEFNGRFNFLGCSSYFAISKPVNKMYKDDECWVISSRSNTKNYDSEIEVFLEWIKPYIEGGSGNMNMYAIVIYEDSSEPLIYYLD